MIFPRFIEQILLYGRQGLGQSIELKPIKVSISY